MTTSASKARCAARSKPTRRPNSAPGSTCISRSTCIRMPAAERMRARKLLKHNLMEQQMITLIQRCGLALACLVLAGLPGTAQAEWTTGKITYFHLYTNSGGDNTSVKIGPYNLSANGSLAALLREAFLR